MRWFLGNQELELLIMSLLDDQNPAISDLIQGLSENDYATAAVSSKVKELMFHYGNDNPPLLRSGDHYLQSLLREKYVPIVPFQD